MHPVLQAKYRTRVAREINRVPAGNGIKLRVVLVFPAPYRIGMANLGFQLVYSLFNHQDGVCCHRAFLPDPEEKIIYDSHRESVRSLESFEQLSDYDVVAFSINYENSLPDLIRILDLARIPIFSNLRESHHPLVIAGGVVPTINPEPIAEFMDACVLGETEEILPVFSKTLAETWTSGRCRTDTLAMLSRVPGVYIPSFYSPVYSPDGVLSRMVYTGPLPEPSVSIQHVADLNPYPSSSMIHTPESEFPFLHLVEVSRSCPRTCRFCLIPSCFGPFRCRSQELILSGAETAPPDYRIGLLGAGAADHPDLISICRKLREQGKQFSFSSLHASEIVPELAELVLQSGPHTITLAPETGTEQRRRKIGKRISDDHLLEAVRLIGRPPTRVIKLYFIIGLPGETMEDIQSIITLCANVSRTILQTCKTAHNIPRLSIGISCFVPKAYSSFQRSPMNTEVEFNRRIKVLASAFRHIKEIRWHHDVPKWAIVQGLLARGDRRITPLVVHAGRNKLTRQDILKASAQSRIHQYIPLFQPLPWDHLNRENRDSH